MNDYGQLALLGAYSFTALALLYLALQHAKLGGVCLALGLMVMVGSVRRIEFVTGAAFPDWVASTGVPLAFSAALLLLVCSIAYYALGKDE